uniref:Uncharacterized protein n=1 Tax=Timema cristinae TaxID=61476 RepID=A0A7R9CUG8_TIMCR|nr:unnamed protein product [Timema cristinae]
MCEQGTESEWSYPKRDSRVPERYQVGYNFVGTGSCPIYEGGGVASETMLDPALNSHQAWATTHSKGYKYLGVARGNHEMDNPDNAFLCFKRTEKSHHFISSNPFANSATEPGSMSSRAEQAVLQDVLDDGLDELLGEYDAVDAGFKRRERLDVKKPGPQFSTNNYAFHHDGEEKEDAATDKNGRRAQLNMPRPTSRRNSGNEETVSNGHGDDDTKDNQQGNLDDFFCHENQTPPALSKNSDLCFGNKFDLVDCLEKLNKSFSS